MFNEDEMCLVLLGKTGYGKSATGNTILGETVFSSKQSAKSVTDVTKSETKCIGETPVKIVDTPGLFDTRTCLSKDKLEKEITKSVTLSVPGPHAFLYVIRIGRFTEEDSQTTTKILDLFSDKIYPHMIIVFTGTDALDKGQSLEDFIKDEGVFDTLLMKCNNRWLGVNNRLAQNEKKEFVDHLLQMVTGLKKDLGHYTNDTLQQATAQYEKRVKDLQRKNPDADLESIKQKVDYEIKNDGTMLDILLGGAVGIIVAAGIDLLIATLNPAGAVALAATAARAALRSKLECIIS